MVTRKTMGCTSVVVSVGMLAACGGSNGNSEDINIKPSYLGAIQKATYDGETDDLLTAGLGKTRLPQL